MDDLLSRMLEIEQQGNAAVKDAEARAVTIREEGAAAVAQANSEFSQRLAQECAAIEESVIAKAEEERRQELAVAASQLPGDGAAFDQAAAKCEEQFFLRLTALQ